MARGQLHTVIRQLRRIVDAQGTGGLTDAQLLERFVTQRDEAAFELLVWRHGAMVLHTCQGTLRSVPDAEDAFQATFLALVRQARSILKREAVAGWLHRVAHRIALRARSSAARRTQIEKQAVLLPPGGNPRDAESEDLRLILDEEINRLPDKYRVPIVLCYLEGKTNDEAAHQLGCPRGTILSRLARARERLRARLTRRGIALTAGGLGVALGSPAAGSVPAALVVSTIKAATLVAAGQAAATVVSAKVAALTEGVLQAMFLTKVKIAAVVLVTVAVAGSGLGLFAHGNGTRAAEQPAVSQNEKLAPSDTADEPAPEDRLRQQKELLEKELQRAEDALRSAQASRDALEERLRLIQDLLKKQLIQDLLKKQQLLRTPRGGGDEQPKAPAWKEWAVIQGHTQPVWCVAFSPDGRTLTSGGQDGLIQLSDVDTGKVLRQIQSGKLGVTHVAFSPDGKLLASSGGEDNRVRIWEAATGKQLRQMQGHNDTVLRVAFAPDGKRLATAGQDKTIRVWEVNDGRQVQVRGEHAGAIWSLAFSPDGKTLASASHDRTVRLWDVTAAKSIRQLAGESKFWALAYSPDGKLIATGSDDGTIHLWEAATGKELARFRGHRDAVTSLAFAPDGKSLVSGSRDRTIRLWQIPSGAEVLVGQHQGAVLFVAFSPDGKTLASVGEDKAVRLWSQAQASGGPSPETARSDDRLDQLLKELLAGKRSDEQIVEALYLATLARLPTSGERKFALDHLTGQKDRPAAFANVLWSLINSKEFSANVESLNKKDPRQPRK